MFDDRGVGAAVSRVLGQSLNGTAADFWQPGKSLYTTIREFVENSLDAAEEIGELPDIDVTM